MREKATESEAVVRDITRDIQVLDLAKENLISSMTTLKRLQMLGKASVLSTGAHLLYENPVNALSQLEDLVEGRNYTEIAQSLSVISLRHLPVTCLLLTNTTGGKGTGHGISIDHITRTRSPSLETDTRCRRPSTSRNRERIRSFVGPFSSRSCLTLQTSIVIHRRHPFRAWHNYHRFAP
jgi:hypothetical protein